MSQNKNECNVKLDYILARVTLAVLINKPSNCSGKTQSILFLSHMMI